MNWASAGPRPAAAVALVSTETQTPREAETPSSDTSSASAIIQEQVDDRMLVHEIHSTMVTNMEGSSSPSTTPFEPDVDQLRAGEHWSFFTKYLISSLYFSFYGFNHFCGSGKSTGSSGRLSLHA